jgi:hypothetical protein
VRAGKLGAILNEAGLHRVDFLKMNIEGAETAALAGMGEVLPLTRHLVVSCHDFRANRGEGEGFRTFDAARRLLTGAGFRLRTRPDDPRVEVPFYLYASRDLTAQDGGGHPPSGRSG